MSRKTLGNRISFYVILTFIVFSLLLAVSDLYYSYSLIRKEAEEKLTSMVRSQANLLNIELIKQKTLAEEVARYVSVTFDGTRLVNENDYLWKYKEEIAPYLYKIAEAEHNAWIYFNPFLKNEGHDVWFVDMDGDGIPERQPEQGLDYYSDRENKDWFFKPMDTGKPLWTNPYLTTIFTGQDISWISYSIPIFVDNTFIGVTGHDYLFNDFRERFKHLSAFESGYGVLLNDAFQILIHPEFPALTGISELGSGDYKQVVDKTYEQPDGILRYRGRQGQLKITAFSRLTNNWVMMVTVDEADVFRDLYARLRFAVLVILLGVIVSSLLIFGVTRYLTQSLSIVSRAIDETGKGDYETPIPAEFLTDQGEIGILSRSVEVLRRDLKQSFLDLNNYSSGLEQLVVERTRELDASLEDLKKTQADLVTTKKFEAINRFLMEIAHRLNTPLGNAGMAVSVLVNLLEQTDGSVILDRSKNNLFERFVEASNMAGASIRISSEVIASLQEIARDFEGSEGKVVDVSQPVLSGLKEIREAYSSAAQLAVQVSNPEELSVSSYPLLIKDLFFRLFSFSLLLPERELPGVSIKNTGNDFVPEERTLLIEIDVRRHDEGVAILYRDKGLTNIEGDFERIFEPYATASFQNDTSGMELYIIYNIIRLGLQGRIDFVDKESGGPGFRIFLPGDLDGTGR